ncbi:mycofactocin system transcriptional regulator [Georgenia sp. TF02-10]|uniref:mycofactocin system transcriptional regulator n=1 Tax=Georgenia sp. TF02-10 TaxID=2917725 RepID=UPI001FA7BCFF|nr:mycofactocin system transcriptional regulator [Georgenia sp. TF02-10]UNX54213.1 mycofactocin system transcriptional regulator [Georgenia sp. TF02-10]
MGGMPDMRSPAAGGAAAPPRPGRPPATTHRDLERLGIEMFTRSGYARTSVQDIADAAGISRRTFFRYFPTKADVVWGDFDREVDRLRATLDEMPAEAPMMTALRLAVVEFNRVPATETEHHRARLRLILGAPDLLAHSMLKFAGWRRAVAGFAARRLHQAPQDLHPQVVGECALGAAVAAYRRWLDDDRAQLTELIDEAFRLLERMDLPAAAAAGAAGGHR